MYQPSLFHLQKCSQKAHRLQAWEWWAYLYPERFAAEVRR